MERYAASLARALGPTCPQLLALLAAPPPGSLGLLMLMLAALADDALPPQPLVAAAAGHFSKSRDATLLAPLVAALPKPDVVKLLPHLVAQLSRPQLRLLYRRLTTVPPPPAGLPTAPLPPPVPAAPAPPPVPGLPPAAALLPVGRPLSRRAQRRMRRMQNAPLPPLMGRTPAPPPPPPPPRTAHFAPTELLVALHTLRTTPSLRVSVKQQAAAIDVALHAPEVFPVAVVVQVRHALT